MQSFSGQNYNSSQEENSGMNLKERNELGVGGQFSGNTGRSSDRPATPLNIDDLPVPAKGTKTFDQILEEKLKQNNDNEEDPQVTDRQVPKKQFLKRKSQPYVPPKAPSKQYKYYSDAFDQS